MKTVHSYLIGLALVGGLTTQGYAQLAPEAPQTKAPSLAEQMPADTLLYVEIPDISGLREGIAQSSLGKIYRDPEMQEFIGGGLALLDEQWENLRGMSAGMGIPEGLTYFEALQSVEFGLAIRANPQLENPFSAPPQIYGALHIGLGEGLGAPVFNLISTYADGSELELIGTEDGEILVVQDEMFTMEIAQAGDSLNVTFLMGAKGEGSLANDPRYLAAREGTFANGSVMFGYLQWNDVLETVLKGLSFEAPMFHAPAQRFYDRALKPLESMALATGWNEQGTFTNIRIAMNGDGDGLYATGPADMDLLKYVPSDATSFFVKSDPTGFGPFLMETMDDFLSVEVDGMVLKDAVAMEAPEVHTWLFGDKRPELDAAIAGFGSRSFGYGTSGGVSSESLMFQELTDGAAVSNMLTQLMPRFRELLDMNHAPVRLDMKRVKKRVKAEDGSISNVAGPAYYMVEFAFLDELPPQMSSLTSSFQPTFGVTEDGWLVFSMSKASVRRLLMNGLEVPEENIKTNPDVEGFLSRVPAGVSAMEWSDPRPGVDQAAGLALGLLPMGLSAMKGQVDLPFEAEKIPSADLFTRYLRPSEAIAWMGEGETMYKHVGSFGLADMFTAAGACAAIAPPIGMMFAMQGDVMMEPTEYSDEEEF
ncbi:MAG: hypothetical protein ACPG31_01755 [Planctomycetota bacterium]